MSASFADCTTTYIGYEKSDETESLDILQSSVQSRDAGMRNDRSEAVAGELPFTERSL